MALAVLAAPSASGGAAGAQEPGPSVIEDPLRVYLVTMGPGVEVWNRFGHNAIWIHDDRTGEDLVWNWGLFSFSQVGFVPRLIRGEMLYSMGGFTLRQTLSQYEAEGRDVWAQELALTPAQKEDLDRFVRRNAQPANRDYLYDYYRDNCSTRVRDALDLVLDGAMERHFSAMGTGTTWRWHTRRLVQGAPWVYAGIALVLGHPGDERITAWDEMFLPMRLRAHMAGFFIEQRDGSMRPLVLDEVQLVQGVQGLPPEAPDAKWPRFLMVGLGVAAGILVLGFLAGTGPVGRALVALPVAAWSLLAGVGGTVLLAAYFTDHVFWWANENVFQATPLSLAVAILVLGGVFRPRLTGTAARTAVWVVVLSALGVALKAVPLFHQGNVEILVLALPVHLAVLVVLRRRAFGGADRAAA